MLGAGSRHAGWLAGYHYRGGPLPEHAVRLLTRHDQVRFASVSRAGTVVGIARGARGRGLAGRHRRRGGCATPPLRGGRRADAGAAGLGPAARVRRSCYLQVDEDNAEALAFYQRLGFIAHHRYHYRIAPATELSHRPAPGRLARQTVSGAGQRAEAEQRVGDVGGVAGRQQHVALGSGAGQHEGGRQPADHRRHRRGHGVGQAAREGRQRHVAEHRQQPGPAEPGSARSGWAPAAPRSPRSSPRPAANSRYPSASRPAAGRAGRGTEPASGTGRAPGPAPAARTLLPRRLIRCPRRCRRTGRSRGPARRARRPGCPAPAGSTRCPAPAGPGCSTARRTSRAR